MHTLADARSRFSWYLDDVHASQAWRRLSLGAARWVIISVVVVLVLLVVDTRSPQHRVLLRQLSRSGEPGSTSEPTGSAQADAEMAAAVAARDAAIEERSARQQGSGHGVLLKCAAVASMLRSNLCGGRASSPNARRAAAAMMRLHRYSCAVPACAAGGA